MTAGSYGVGEGFEGDGPEAAHINLLVGDRAGPLGAAFATALASPSAGHTPFLVVARPGLALQPPTLFVNKAPIAGDDHARLTWGPAQTGVAAGIIDALEEGSIDPTAAGSLVVIAAVWVDPTAVVATTVHENNRRATRDAARRAAAGDPPVGDVLGAAGDVRNPFFTPPPGA
ncbi:MAG: formaldehyde-activating enzyme [Microthrixaceae bacterium]